MKPIFKTVCEIVWVTLAFSAALAGLFWLLRLMGLSWGGTILLLAPVGLLGGLACVYGYSLGRRREEDPRQEVRRVASLFQDTFRILGFFVLVMTPVLLAGYFLSRGNPAPGMSLAVLAGLVSLWVMLQIGREMRRFRFPHVRGARDAFSRWLAFERTFRILVFGLLLVIPVVLSVVFLLIYQDIPVTALLGIIAAGLAPWAVRKIRSEIQRPNR